MFVTPVHFGVKKSQHPARQNSYGLDKPGLGGNGLSPMELQAARSLAGVPENTILNVAFKTILRNSTEATPESRVKALLRTLNQQLGSSLWQQRGVYHLKHHDPQLPAFEPSEQERRTFSPHNPKLAMALLHLDQQVQAEKQPRVTLPKTEAKPQPQFDPAPAALALYDTLVLHAHMQRDQNGANWPKLVAHMLRNTQGQRDPASHVAQEIQKDVEWHFFGTQPNNPKITAVAQHVAGQIAAGQTNLLEAVKAIQRQDEAKTRQQTEQLLNRMNQAQSQSMSSVQAVADKVLHKLSKEDHLPEPTSLSWKGYAHHMLIEGHLPGNLAVSLTRSVRQSLGLTEDNTHSRQVEAHIAEQIAPGQTDILQALVATEKTPEFAAAKLLTQLNGNIYPQRTWNEWVQYQGHYEEHDQQIDVIHQFLRNQLKNKRLLGEAKAEDVAKVIAQAIHPEQSDLKQAITALLKPSTTPQEGISAEAQKLSALLLKGTFNHPSWPEAVSDSLERGHQPTQCANTIAHHIKREIYERELENSVTLADVTQVIAADLGEKNQTLDDALQLYAFKRDLLQEFPLNLSGLEPTNPLSQLVASLYQSVQESQTPLSTTMSILLSKRQPELSEAFLTRAIAPDHYDLKAAVADVVASRQSGVADLSLKAIFPEQKTNGGPLDFTLDDLPAPTSPFGKIDQGLAQIKTRLIAENKLETSVEVPLEAVVYALYQQNEGYSHAQKLTTVIHKLMQAALEVGGSSQGKDQLMEAMKKSLSPNSFHDLGQAVEEVIRHSA